MMTDQQLQEMEMDFTDDDVSVRDYVAHGKTLIAEVRRLQQQAEGQPVLKTEWQRLVDERDGALAERDAARATAQQDRELHDARSARRIKRIEKLEAALTEARRVLRLLRDLVKDGLCGHPDLEDLEGVEDTDEPHDVEACYECRSVACLAEADVVLAQEAGRG